MFIGIKYPFQGILKGIEGTGSTRFISSKRRLTKSQKQSIQNDQKKLEEAAKKDQQLDNTFDDAISVLKKYCLGVQPIHLNMQISEEASNKLLRGQFILPKTPPTYKAPKLSLLIFATGEKAEEAKKLGAKYVGGEELFDDLKENTLQFDACLCTKEMFPKVIKIAKVLGPKGLMPSPGKGTVSDDIQGMIDSLKNQSLFEFKNQEYTLEIGSSDWDLVQIRSNVDSIVSAVNALKPSKVESNKFWNSINIAGSFTPAVKIPLHSLVQDK